MKTPAHALLPFLLLGLGAGCVLHDQNLSSEPPPTPAKNGVVFVVGGIGGLDVLGHSAQWVLPGKGIAHELRPFNWQHGKGRFLKDLQDRRHIDEKATELADEVRRLKKEDPERPVYLIGHSAGGGLVLAAAEKLPPASLERLILLSPAVAPEYDLRPAFKATRREVVSFNSELDFLVLGLGTTQFGTVDHVHTPSAGMVGFKPPPGLSKEERLTYERLVQKAWKPEMLLQNYRGGHNSTSMPGFLAQHVAPWLRP